MAKNEKANFITDNSVDKTACIELKNAKFVDVINSCFLEPETNLIIKGNKILAIKNSQSQKDGLKPDLSFDLKGKTVLPGLFNTHCHTTGASSTLFPKLNELKLFKKFSKAQIEKNMAECLTHGITNIRDSYAEDLLFARSFQERIARQEIFGPRIIQSIVVGPSGGYLTESYDFAMKFIRAKLLGVPSLDHNDKSTGVVEFPTGANTQTVRDAVDRAIEERGAMAIKIGEQKENMTDFKPNSTIMTMHQLSTIADQAARRGLKSIMHIMSADSFLRGAKAGVDVLAHLPKDKLLSQNDIDWFTSGKSMIEPTVSVMYACSYKLNNDAMGNDPYFKKIDAFRKMRHDELVDEYWIPEFKTPALEALDKLNNNKTKLFGLIPLTAMYQYYSSFATTGARNLKLLYENGVDFSTSNDGGVPPCTVPMMQNELDLFDLILNQVEGKKVFLGADALKTATINSAKCLGIEDDFGSIEVGKTADLAVVDGDPFKDHHVIGSRVAALFMDGSLVINNCNLNAKALPPQ